MDFYYENKFKIKRLVNCSTYVIESLNNTWSIIKDKRIENDCGLLISNGRLEISEKNV